GRPDRVGRLGRRLARRLRVPRGGDALRHQVVQREGGCAARRGGRRLRGPRPLTGPSSRSGDTSVRPADARTKAGSGTATPDPAFAFVRAKERSDFPGPVAWLTALAHYARSRLTDGGTPWRSTLTR